MCFFKRKKKKEKVTEEKVQPKEEKVVEEKKVEKPKEEVVEEQKEVKNIYHISQNKDSKSPHFKRWRVRKANSQKTIQYFDTQAEAIEFAQELADNNDGSIVIHKLDGKIRKQDYSKNN